MQSQRIIRLARRTTATWRTPIYSTYNNRCIQDKSVDHIPSTVLVLYRKKDEPSLWVTVIRNRSILSHIPAWGSNKWWIGVHWNRQAPNIVVVRRSVCSSQLKTVHPFQNRETTYHNFDCWEITRNHFQTKAALFCVTTKEQEQWRAKNKKQYTKCNLLTQMP